MRSSRTLNRLSVTADDDHLVDHAGLLLAATLGQQLGLPELFAERLRLAQQGANVAEKALTVVHALLAGADCIDDGGVPRSGPGGVGRRRRARP